MDGEKDYYETHELPDFDLLWDERSSAVSARTPDFDISASVADILGDEEREETDTERRRRNTRDFCKGFFAALAVMAPLCAFTLFAGYDPLGLDTSAREASETVASIPVAATGGCTLLCAVTTQGGEPLALSLVRADADAGEMRFCELPLESVMLDSLRPAELAEIWDAKGLSGVTAAVSGTLGVRVDASAALPVDSLAALVDELGGFRMSLDRDVVVYAPGGLVEYSKHRGASDFCGNDVKQLLLHAPHEASELARLRERVFEAAYKAAAGDELAGRVSRFYSERADELETDLSAAGMYSLTRILDAARMSGEGRVQIVRLEGVYTSDGRFELDEGCPKALRGSFPAAEVDTQIGE